MRVVIGAHHVTCKNAPYGDFDGFEFFCKPQFSLKQA